MADLSHHLSPNVPRVGYSCCLRDCPTRRPHIVCDATVRLGLLLPQHGTIRHHKPGSCAANGSGDGYVATGKEILVTKGCVGASRRCTARQRTSETAEAAAGTRSSVHPGLGHDRAELCCNDVSLARGR